jgi:hypothetical protein
MKVYIQIIDQGHKFQIAYENNVIYGTFNMPKRDEKISEGNAVVPTWAMTQTFVDQLYTISERYFNQLIVGIEDTEWHPIVTTDIFNRTPTGFR